MKVFINTDLEGICCFVDWDEANMPTGRGIGYTKEYLTEEINAAIGGILLEEPDSEIIVMDGHYGGWWGPNIIAEKLHPRASLILGKRGTEHVGLSDDIDLVMAIGMHSMAGTRHGCMNHTIGTDSIMNFWVDGVLVGEIGIWAALAGSYGIPLAMVSGDYWAVEEAKALLGNIVGAAVKKGINRYSATCMNPLEARRLIAESARQAVARLGEFKPYIVNSPTEIKIEYTNTSYADKAELGGAERLDGRAVRYIGENFTSAFCKIV